MSVEKRRRHRWPKPSSAGTRGNATPDQRCLDCGMERTACSGAKGPNLHWCFWLVDGRGGTYPSGKPIVHLYDFPGECPGAAP